MLTGIVKRGKGIGRQLAFPTANISIEESYKLIPKNGVYFVNSILKNEVVYGMMNIGFNPTVDGSKKSIEVHYFDFEGDLYNQTVQVNLLERIRDEHKFNSLEELKNQLQKDRATSISLIKN